MTTVAPEMIIFAVRALIRVGVAARESFEQKVRDANIIMPLPDKLELESITHIRTIAEDDQFKNRFLQGVDLAEFWDADREMPLDNVEAQKKIVEAVELIWETKLATPDEKMMGGAQTAEETGYLVLKQWADKSKPPPPLARVVLAMAEVALEFVGTNPSILGIGSSGEKLVTALSMNLRNLLPDADNPQNWTPEDWSKYYFARRAMAIFLHAGLKTIAEKPDLLIDEKEYRALATNVLTPLVTAFEEADDEQGPSLIVFRDTLFGPMASAAFRTLASYQEDFLGLKFSDSKAVGAVSKALLETIAEAGKADIRDVFSDDGLVQLYQSVLGVMVTRPELFVGRGSNDDVTLKQDFFINIARALKDSPPPFKSDLAAPLAIAALKSLGNYAAGSLDENDEWEALSETLIIAFIDGLKVGLKEKSLEKVLSRDQMVVFAQIFFAQAAKTPGMLLPKPDNKELRHLVAAVANAMAEDTAKLLSGEDWLVIAQVAAEEAAQNPDRLFKIDITNPEKQMAALMIKRLLEGAADSFGTNARRQGKIMFGDTLRHIVTISLKAATGNIEGAADHLDELQALEIRINNLAADNKNRIGMREARLLFEQLIVTIIDDGEVVVVRNGEHKKIPISDTTDEELMRLLALEEISK